MKTTVKVACSMSDKTAKNHLRLSLGTACVDGATKCYPEPIEPCASRGVVIPEGGRNCDASGTRPGTCGFMLGCGRRICTDDRGGQVVSTPPGAPMEKALLGRVHFQAGKRVHHHRPAQLFRQNNLLIRCSEVGPGSDLIARLKERNVATHSAFQNELRSTAIKSRNPVN